MADQDTIRKLAAILNADVVGYSRLMGEDERATIATLRAYRKVFKDTIATHQGGNCSTWFPCRLYAVAISGCSILPHYHLAERKSDVAI
jgi:hypothetical protein